ncbi:MAG TPA: CapA family protein [Pyrinomonadaceae bacterium]|jgi:poly-gamma-glutamate capsule biosynthesis protein CapA/YwtB (metallophosphatase superfamily)
MSHRRWFLFVSCCSLLLIATACKSGSADTRDFPAAPAPVVQSQTAEKISIAAVGDIMLGSTNPPDRGLPAEDGAKMLSEVAPLLSAADIAFGNLEGPMLDGAGKSSKCGPNSRLCYAFRVPTRYGKHLKDAGFDLLSLANNHASDFGLEGRLSTKRVLEQLGITHAGGDRDDIPYLNVKGKRIGVVAFATNEISYNLNDIATARRIVAQVAQKADIVIVSFHGGAEGAAAQNVPRGPETFLGAPRGNLREFTHAVVDAGADLVLGHGPHVVRGIEIYRNRLIAYSLGNFAFFSFPFKGPTALSMILEVSLAPDGAFASGAVRPLIQVGQSGPKPDKDATVLPVLRQLSTVDFGATAVKIGEDGTITAP